MNPLCIPGVLLLSAATAAQSLRVVPNGYESLEGTSASRTPVGWSSSRIQYLVDGSQLCQSAAVITSLQLRLDGGNFNVDAPVAKTFQATIDAYEVPVTPDTMSTDWSVNIGSAVSTTVYNGTLQVPAASRQWPYPNPFTVDIQLTQPIVYQRSAGNLMLDVILTGGSGDNWPADGFYLHATEARGEITRIWEDSMCTGPSGSMSLSVPDVLGNGVIGSSLQIDHTVAPAAGASIPFVIHVLSLQNRQWNGSPLPFGLGAYQAPGCTWHIGLEVSALIATSTPSQVWPLPLSPAYAGVPLFTQAIGLDVATGIVVPSQNAFQVRLGAAAPPPGPAQMVHRSNYAAHTTGFKSPTGYYGLVVGFVGTFQ